MANFLGYECPKCGSTDQIEVSATVWLRLDEDGTDADAADNNDHHYEDDSLAICQACSHQGQFRTFAPPEPVPLLDALKQALTALNTAPRFSVPSLSSNSYAIASLCEKAIKLANDDEAIQTAANSRRAEWADEALRAFQKTTGADREDAVSDLLCDLMHLADRNGFDFQHELSRARNHYEPEKRDGE